MSTIYIKHKLFHQSKPARNVELQNTRIVLFKFPRDVMQGSARGAQLGIGSELVDWYRDATSVLYRQLLIDLSPRTDDRLRYCPINGPIHSNFCIRNRLKQSKVLDGEHTKYLYSPCVPIIFPQMQKSFPSVMPKRVCRVPERMYSKISQRKLAKHKNTTRDKTSKRSLISLSKKNHLEEKKRRSGIRKRVTTRKSSYSSRHYSFVLTGSSFFLVPAPVYNKGLNTQSVTKQEIPKYQLLRNPMYQIDSFKKEINKKLFAKADSSVNQNLFFFPRIKLSNTQILILDGVENGVLLSDFAQQRSRKNADVPDINFTFLDAAGRSPTLVLNRNAKTKEGEESRSLSQYERQKVQRL